MNILEGKIIYMVFFGQYFGWFEKKNCKVLFRNIEKLEFFLI